jgi:hypothetical protein
MMYISPMSTITAILEADADGTLHLPLPVELRAARLKVTAIIQDVRDPGERPTREDALAALRKLRELGTFKEITDPVAWQREIRKDRPLPGRD